ncbi:MAG: hypothetical protein KA112_03345 [Alphaproteobacteria bacterium]|jgi:hypothetical protein|nr:hypothetical protein [Alphaproteobacteria bacterium]MBP7729631.1 hypothetical protein [Alphaproteobacteria bacterium]
MKLTIFQYQANACKAEFQETEREKINKIVIRISDFKTDDYNISKNFLIEKIKSFQKKEETVFMKLDFVQCELSGSCLDDLNAELNKCNINNHKYKNFTLEIGIDK